MAEMDMSKNVSKEELIAFIRALEAEKHQLEQTVAKQQLQLQNLSEMLMNGRRHTFGQSSEQGIQQRGARAYRENHPCSGAHPQGKAH